MPIPFEDFVTESASINSLENTLTDIPGFRNELFYNPIYLDKKSPLYISPFNLVMRIPRSTKCLNSSLYQVSCYQKEKEIMGMCVPDILEWHLTTEEKQFIM